MKRDDERNSAVRPNLPYQDHYELARDAAIERLRQRFDPDRLARLGAELRQEGAIELPTLCWRFAIGLEPFSMVLLPGDGQVSIVWQILALDYLGGEPAGGPARFLSFAEFPQVRSYLKAFEGRVTGRLSRGVGGQEETFVRAAERCLGARGSGSPLSYLFRLFPRFELQVVRHEGDGDFPPSCNVLFPDNALRVLSAESVIVAAERLVSSLEGKSPSG